MTTITLDTHKVIIALKKRGFSEDQAEGITEAIQEVNLDQVTTKADLFELKAEIFKWLIPLFLGQYALLVGILLKMH